MPSTKKPNHYVDNKKFCEEMVKFRTSVIEAKSDGVKRPQVPDYIGECFVKIAEHLSYKPNFINYTFREDMVSDGIENCLQYIDNFDPTKSHNPFAYFTQIIYYAFLRRIQREKKQLYIKYKALERAGYEADPVDVQEGDTTDYKIGKFTDDIYANMYDFIESFESKKKKKAEAAKKS